MANHSKQSKKDLILATANKLFVTQGYQPTSIQMIAQAANVSQVTIYKYYESKQLLAHKVVLGLITDGYADFQKIVDDSKLSFKSLVKQMILTSSMETKDMHPDFLKFMIKDLSGEFGNHESINAYEDGKAKFWGTVIKRGRKEGVISPTISNQAIMVYLEMFVQFSQNPKNKHLYENSPSTMLSITDELQHMFFYGLIGKGDEEE